MRAFVVTLLVLIVGLFVGLALLDLVKILVFIRVSAPSIGVILWRGGSPQREVVDELARRVFALPGVEERHLRARGSRFVAAGGK